MKNYRCRSFLIAIIFLTCLVSPQLSRAAEKHFLWRATGNSSTVYLLGSVHFMKQEAYPLNKVIEDAFEKCDTLAVEADINNVTYNTLDLIRRAGFYEAGDSLANHISRHTYSYVTEEASRLGLPVMALDRQKPWFIGITMSALELMRSGYDPNFGIDKHFLTKATGKKSVVELESLEYQIELLAGLPDDEQESFLMYTLKDLKTLGDEADTLMTAWKTGDTSRIASILAKTAESDSNLKAVYKKIMTDRNRNMVRKIATYLNSKGRIFVVVGAGHMVGNDGIIELLRKKGFKVDQL